MLLEPQAIFPDNVKDVIDDGFTTAERGLHGTYADCCTKATSDR